MLLVGLCFADDSKRREPPKELLPLLDSPTEFSLYLADRAEIGEGAEHLYGIIEALAQAGETNRAHALCQKALDVTERIRIYQEHTFMGRPCSESYAAIAAVLAKTGDVQSAYALARKIQALANAHQALGYYEAPSLCVVADAISSADDKKLAGQIRDWAWEAVGRIQDTNKSMPIDFWVVDTKNKAMVLSRIAKSYSDAGERNRAITLCRQIVGMAMQITEKKAEHFVLQELTKLDILAEVTNTLAQTGDRKQAQAIRQEVCKGLAKLEAEIPDLGYYIFKRSIVSSVAKWRKEWGQAQVANEVLESALRDANKIDSPPTDRIDALCSIAGAFAEIAEAKKAQKVRSQALKAIERIRSSDPKWRDASLWFELRDTLRVAKLSRNAGDLKEARAIYQKALDAISTMESKEYKTKLLCMIGTVLPIQDDKMKKTFDADDKPMVEAILTALPAR